MKKYLALVFVLQLGFFIGEAAAQNAAEQSAAAAPQYTAADLLAQRPRVKNIDCDYPSPEEIEKCTVAAISGGWVVKSPEGQTLRAFFSVGGKRTQVHFYKSGIEVFRQIIGPRDSNPPHEFRWMNHAGTRWGIDANLDGVIDQWKMISAEEVSLEAIAALISKDAQQFLRLAPSAEELTALGLAPSVESQARQKIGKMKEEFANVVQGLRLSTKAEWLGFNGGQPGIVPASKDGNPSDVIAYENVSVFVRDGENSSDIKQVILGTIVKVGENNWRLIGVPHWDDPASPQIVADYTFFVPEALLDYSQGPTTVPSSGGDEINKIMEMIGERQNALPETPAKDRAAIHEDILALMLQCAILQSTLTTIEDAELWIRSAADMVDAAVRVNEYPGGPKKLELLFERVKAQFESVEPAAYVKYRQIMAEYYQQWNERLNDNEDISVLQRRWEQKIESFIEEYGQTEGAARAMLELAAHHEMNQSNNEAARWYQRIAQAMPQSDHGKRAAGAVRRIASVGKVVPFTSKTASGAAFNLAQLKGNPVVLYFWDHYTDTESATLRQVATANRDLRIVAINVDDQVETVKEYLTKNPMPQSFIQVFDTVDGVSQPGLYWGLQLPPMMILIDAEGKVVKQNISNTADLVKALDEMK